jgi:hypothetical protein
VREHRYPDPDQDGALAVQDLPIRQVPPGSTPLRELLHSIDQALALSAPAAQRDELTYLRITRDRARVVLLAVRKLLRDREAGDGDVMITVATIRDQVSQLPDDGYDHEPPPFIP